MRYRKLEQKERKKTRALWESVFTEDTKAFLDYYYRRKTLDNQIYVVEDKKKIVSMLQLNPYPMRIGQTRVSSHYIIAVATEKEYRSQGMMRTLLCQAMQDLYQKKEPFTFLMPAAEAIYSPYDFRFVYDQAQTVLTGTKMEQTDCQLRMTEAALEDTGKMASFAMRYLRGRYQIYVPRDEEYYLTMLMEQKSENGGVKLIWNGKRLVGMFAYAREESWEVREPVFMEGFEPYFSRALYEMTGSETEQVKCYAWNLPDNQANPEVNTMPDTDGAEWAKTEKETDVVTKPIIMVRILYLQKLFCSMRVKAGEEICCSFAVIDPLLHANSRIWKLTNEENGKVRAGESEDSDGVLTIGALTSFLFGYRTLDEIAGEENVFLSEALRMELDKLELLDRIFLNEIV